MDVLILTRVFFLLATITTLSVYYVPALRSRFLAAGFRSTPADSSRQGSQSEANGQNKEESTIKRALDAAADLRVPHNWFGQFYVVAVCFMSVWTYQLITRGRLFQFVSESSTITKPSMSFNRLCLCCGLFQLHVFRRLYESLTFLKPTRSTMWAGHWVFGHLFYILLPIVFSIEGFGALRSYNEPFGNVTLSAPSPVTMLCIPIFILASGIQHDCHRYLASLKKYTLPTHPAFISVACPHYTAECVIYLAMTFMAAPQGLLVNKSVLQVFLFVFVNQAVAAHLNREWYIEKFGKDNVGMRRRLIPGFW